MTGSDAAIHEVLGQGSHRRSVNQHLVKAVVAVLSRTPCDGLHERLAAYTPDDWNCSYEWLDASGLELSVFERISALQIADAVPAVVRARMERNLADNRVRTAKLFEEFVRINDAFQQEKLNYCNVMGISLAPMACPEPMLRRQLTLDFLVSDLDPGRCTKLLAGLGYPDHTDGEQFREFRPSPEPHHLDSSIYASLAHRSIGVYFLSAQTEGIDRAPYDMLMRRRTRVWNDYAYPALADPDQFVAQAIRVFGHIGIEWGRLAMLLELSMCVRFWSHHEDFWREVIDRAQEHPLRPVAIGTATRLAKEILGCEIPEALQDWATNKVDAHVSSWSDLYRWDSLLTQFPGTTLLALLQGTRDAETSGGRHSA